ncbi:MAG: MFS transporter, partial [Segatella copri]
MTVSLNHLGDLVRKRVAVAAYYFVPGVVFASWASRIPDVKQMLHLSNGQLGTVLFAIPIGQLLMMAFSGVLVSKFGSRKMILLAEVLYAFVLFCMGSSSTVFQLILSLVAFGMMANLMNIATNTQACLVEKMYGRNIMSSFHGLWSLGGFSGGIIGAVFANTLLPIEAHFGAVLVMSLLIIAIGFRYLVDDATAKAEEEDVPKFSFKTIDPILFLLGLMGFAGMFCEGTVYDWSGVYFSSVVKPDEAFIRAGYVA